MKNSLGTAVLLFFNSLFAISLLLLYLTSFISPKTYPITGVVNLFTALFIVINLLFIIIWIIRRRKYFLISLLTILIGWYHISKLYKFSSPAVYPSQGIKVMSYNVMQFYNLGDKEKNTYTEIQSFINTENPDIIGFQEFNGNLQEKFPAYKYKVENNSYPKLKTVICSKFPILNYEKIDFDSNNSGIYADVKIESDTIRVFSIHFESLNLKDEIEYYKERTKLKYKQFKRVFGRQIAQFNRIEKLVNSSPYPVVICTDMNNTALSYLYREIISLNLKDTFKESGSGYGKTFTFKYLPVRIDMIFVSENIKSNNFKNYRVDHSDHFPISTFLEL